MIAGGAFKMYYDKSEAEKEAMATQLQQAMDNQQRLENAIADQNERIEKALAEQKSITRKDSELNCGKQ